MAPGAVGSADAPPSNGRRGPTLTLSSSVVFLISLAIQAMGFIPTFFFARGIALQESGRALLGTVQLMLFLASSVTGIGDLRIGTAYTYFLSRGQSPKESTGTYFLLRVGMVATAGVFLWVSAPYLPYHSATDYVEVFAIWMTLPILWSVSTVYTQLRVGQGDSIGSQLPLLVESIVRVSALTYVSFHSPTIWTLTLSYLLGAAASTAMTIPAVYAQRGTFRRSEAVRMFRYAWPLMASLVLLYLAGNAIQVLVTVTLSSSRYNEFLAANGYRILVLSLPAAASVPLFPYFARLHKDEGFQEIRAQTWRALRYTGMAVIPGVIALTVYRIPVLNIMYNGTYAQDANVALALLAFSAVPASFSQIIGTTLNGVGQQRLELYLTSLQVAVLFVAAALLLPPVAVFGLFGLDAAAIAVLLSAIAGFALNTYFMESRLAVRIQPWPIVRIAGSSLASFFVISRLNALIPIGRWYVLAGAVLLGFVAYGITLALSGELTKADVRQIGGSMGIPRSLTDAFGRLCWRDAPPEVNDAVPGSARALQPERPRNGNGPLPDSPPRSPPPAR